MCVRIGRLQLPEFRSRPVRPTGEGWASRSFPEQHSDLRASSPAVSLTSRQVRRNSCVKHSSRAKVEPPKSTPFLASACGNTARIGDAGSPCQGDPATPQNSTFNPNWISRPGALVPLIVPKADDCTLLFGWPSWVRLNKLKNSDLN
jgi:hypothetical protein